MVTARPFDGGPAPRVFYIPPGTPQAAVFAQGLRARLSPFGELAVGRCVVLCPSIAAAPLREAFLEASGGGVLAPKFVAFDAADGLLALRRDELSAQPQPSPAVSSARRLAHLTRLAREAGCGSASSEAASALAGLLDETQFFGVSLSQWEAAGPGEHLESWAPARRLLDLARERLPKILAAEGKIDPADRLRQAASSLAEHWRAYPPEAPIIAIGPYAPGSSAALLAHAAACAPQGAAVLAGVSPADDPQILAELTKGRAPEHPDQTCADFLRGVGADYSDLQAWESAPKSLRAGLISEALRPADVSHLWRNAEGFTNEATAGLKLLEAPAPRDEAEAVAAALRQALEDPSAQVILATPDRVLARRAAVELSRWGVHAEPPGGSPLSATAQGAFFLLTAQLGVEGVSPSRLLSVVKHPLCAFGDAEAHSALSGLLETRILRRGRSPSNLAGMRAAAEKLGEQALSAEEAGAPEGSGALALEAQTAQWLAALEQILQPFNALVEAIERGPLAEFVQAHLELAKALSGGAGGELFIGDTGAALEGLAQRLTADSDAFGPLEPSEYPRLLDQILREAAAPAEAPAHPRLRICSPEEAFWRQADVVVLAGLNEGVWPKVPQPDIWTTRAMRLALGLPRLEAQIGAEAWAFRQNACAPNAVLARTRRADGAPTVPSRWLLRLEAVLNAAAPKALSEMRAQGEEFHGMARLLDARAADPSPAPRPAPRPPVEARPRAYSATEIETLIRDPYAIYAKKVLKLRRLDPLNEAPNARDRGELLHAIVEEYVLRAKAQTPERPEALYDEIAHKALREVEAWPAYHVFWLARARQIREWFLRGEAERQEAGAAAALETEGVYFFETALGKCALKARADRIDRLYGGGYVIYDYKTGAPPSDKQVAEFAKQMPLQAAILREAGFEGAPKGDVARLTYLRLSGGRKGGEERMLKGDPKNLGEDALFGLAQLLAKYALPDQPYLSRARPQSILFASDYDHLARAQEWGSSE